MKFIFFIGFFVASFSGFSKEILVKSTADSGPGSLREAVETLANNGDTISIDVKGEIVLMSTLIFDNLSNLTLIGPTAKHIAIKADGTFIGSEIIRITSSSNIKVSNIAFVGGLYSAASFISCLTNSGPVLIERCLFKDITNTSGDGAAIFVDATDLDIRSCSFVNNIAISGGAIYILQGDVDIENSTFWNNQAGDEGGAIYIASNSFLSLTHNTFYQNQAIITGMAVYSASPLNVIEVLNNAFAENGAAGDAQFAGAGSWASLGGNIGTQNPGPDILPWGLGALDQFNTGVVLGLRPTVLVDGFGMMYFPITNSSSDLIDLGFFLAALPPMDMRGAPRVLNGDGLAGPQPDAGACEYTPLRVTSFSGNPVIVNSLPWALAAPQNTNTVNFIEFDIPSSPVTIVPDAQLMLQGNYIIDGFSQPNSAVPGPDVQGGAGVTPANNIININDGAGLPYGFLINGASTSSVITGLRVTNFNQFGFMIFGNNAKVEGCEIGIDDVNNSQPNNDAGINIQASGVKIGGAEHWQRNIISGNGVIGFQTNIYVTLGSANNLILGNIIGLAPNGIDNINGANGIHGIWDAGNATRIGDVSAGNIISAALNTGITCSGCQNLRVFSNKIGTSYNGLVAKPNVYGVFLGGVGSNAMIGKSDSLAGNLISGNTSTQVWVNHFSDVSISNNILGPDVTGMIGLVTSTHGVYIDNANATNIVIGGLNVNDRNLISQNNAGINIIQCGPNVQILNNCIGLKMDGVSILPNTDVGIKIASTSPVLIGFPNAGNIISGHVLGSGIGIKINGATGHIIQSNIIGLNVAGTASLANLTGIQVNGSTNILIGGDLSTGEGNTISGNSADGIILQSGTLDAQIKGNFIGTDITGNFAIANGFSGVHVADADGTLIGGFFQERNIISGQSNPLTQGIFLNSIGQGTVVEGNYIGCNHDGTSTIPNYDGIKVTDSHAAFIGGSIGNENYIVANTNAGIQMISALSLTIDGNRIGIGPTAITAGFGNQHGIYLIGPNANIGGANSNTISNNLMHGIFISGETADATEINNNIIGTSSSNTSGIGNGGDGIHIQDADATLIGNFIANTIIGNDSAGVRLNGAVTGTEILNNNIADFSGSSLTNFIGIYVTGGATLNLIGTSYGVKNTICNSVTDGIRIVNSHNNIIFGNCIGSDGAATAMPNNNGIRIINSDGTAIGNENFTGNGTFNVISGNINAGILLDNSSSTIILSNIIGLNQTGNSNIPNLNGIVLTNGSTANEIGGNGNPLHRNTISGNTFSGINLSSSLNLITDNIIGLTQDGLGAIGIQDHGIILNVGAIGNVIGGDRPTEGNIISSNDKSGIIVLDEANQILGNIFGYSLANVPTGSQPIGIELNSGNAINNIIGAPDSGGEEFGNIIMHQSSTGILIHLGAANNSIAGNYIGIDPTDFTSSTQPVGIEVEASAGIDNKIGDDVVGGGNIISGNNVGIKLDGAVHCFIYNNKIGTNITGANGSVFSNTGIELINSGFNTIGGAGLKSNLISGNAINGIFMTGPSSINNVISGNVIGANFTISSPASNSVGIKIAGGATNNTIGAIGNGLGNLICANSTAGIVVDGANANLFFNNRIGVAFENKSGVVFINGASNNTFGGDASQRNIVSNNDSIGVALVNSFTNQIIGNFIGVSAMGNSAMQNEVGVFINGGGSNIIGNSIHGNVISSNSTAGLVIENSSVNFIQNNFIGTDSTGNSFYAGSGNGIGVVLVNSNANYIGGDYSLQESNVICNNINQGMYLENSSSNEIYGNNIGINRAGDTYIGNGNQGILVNANSNNNLIGNATANFENSITANEIGIEIQSSTNNEIQKNFIGNDATGGLDNALGGSNNQNYGIIFDSLATNNVATNQNIISGNDDFGVLFRGSGTEFNTVSGNYIGVDITGNVAYPNGGGVSISDSAKLNLIGGSTIADRNIISGNSSANQILITGNGVDSNMVKGNLIGLGANETTNIPSTNGIIISNGGKFNQIGGPLVDERNYIVNQTNHGIWFFGSDQSKVFNNVIGLCPSGAPGSIGEAGIMLENSDFNYIGGLNLGTDSANIITNCNKGVSLKAFFLSSYGNPIIGNSIYNNTEQGIDINDNDLVEPVDNVQNLGNNGEIDFPLILTAFSCGSGPTTRVGIEMNYVLTGTYRFDFYSNTNPDAANGEGETFLGGTWFTPTTIPDTMSFDLGVNLPVGTSITSTVTGTLLNTSEFSVNFTVQNQPVGPVLAPTDETCLGANNASINISATDGYYFSSDGFLTNSFGAQAFIFDSLSPGTYNVGVTYLNGCTVEAPVVLNSGAPLTYQTSIVHDTCGLNTGVISIFAESGSFGPFLYSFAGGAVYGSLNDSINLPAGNYDLMIMDSLLGCLSSPVDVNVNSITDVVDESFVFNDFCPSTTVMPTSVATSGGAFTFATAPGDGALINGATGLISGAVTGNSYDIVYTVGLCSEADTITITGLNSDDPTFTMPNFCQGSNAVPVISGLLGGTFSFNPDPADGTIINPSTGNFNGVGGTTYSVMYLTNGACPDSLTIPVGVLTQPAAPTILATDSLYCQGDLIASLNVAAGSTATPNWSIGASTNSPVATGLTYTPSNLLTGNNYFFVKMVDITGCASLSDSINYYLSDLTGMVAIADFETCLGSQAQLNAAGGDLYVWNANPDLSETDIANPTASITGVDTYIVQIINSDGCIVIDSITVSLLPSSQCNVETYNAFSPNEDGINDLWIIDGIEGFSQNQVTVFSRWGDEIIQLDNYNNTTVVWDGKTPDDKTVPSGTYFYVVNVNGTQNQAGWVQVVK